MDKKVVGELVLWQGKVTVIGPYGERACRINQPQEIGICVAEVMAGNMLNQSPYRSTLPEGAVTASGNEKGVLPDDFIEWNGGWCPVIPMVKVEVVFRSGLKAIGTAGDWCWWHDTSHPYAIVAYRIVGGK